MRGFRVYGYDVDREKVGSLMRGELYIYEPGLDELFRRSDSRFKVTDDPREAVLNSEASFITVGTPSKPDGSIDLSYVESAARLIGRYIKEKTAYHLVVVKSTVIPGTTEGLVKGVLESESGKKVGENFSLCVNPEFLREGSAVNDIFNPDRVVIGCVDARSTTVLRMIWEEFYGRQPPPMVETNPVNAELIKYACNAFLAMKISFINLVARVCEVLKGADVEVVANGIGLDRRIGPYFLKAGIGFGGSCFPKDLKALAAYLRSLGIDARLLEEVLNINEEQPLRAVKLCEKHLGNLDGREVCVLGLAFKSGTDDVRESRAIRVVKELLRMGSRVKVYDPVAMHNARCILGNAVIYSSNVRECLMGSECVIIATEWSEFKELKPEDFLKLMRTPIVVDGRRVLEPHKLRSRGIIYEAIGLGP